MPYLTMVWRSHGVSQRRMCDATAGRVRPLPSPPPPGPTPQPPMQVASAHRLGKEHYARRVTKSLFEGFLLVEERFSTSTEATEQEKINSLRTVKV